MENFILSRLICLLFLFVVIQTILGVVTGSAYVTTASGPVTAWLDPVNPDSSDYDKYIYFQGIDNGLYKIYCNLKTKGELDVATCRRDKDTTTTKATCLVVPGNVFSSPCCLHSLSNSDDGWIYFIGPNQEINKVHFDGSELTALHNLKTLSRPCVIWESFYQNGAWKILETVYFESLTHELCKANGDGTGLTDLHVQIFSTPCAVSVTLGAYNDTTYVFYQGINNTLNKLDVSKFITDPAHCVTFLNNYTASTPAVHRIHEHFLLEIISFFLPEFELDFQGTNNHLYSVDSNGRNTCRLGEDLIFSTPCFEPCYDRLYFQSENNKLQVYHFSSLDTDNDDLTANPKIYYLSSTPCSIVRSDGSVFIYLQYDQLLYRVVNAWDL